MEEIEDKPSYQFEETTYGKLCEHAENGDLVEVEKIVNQEDKSSFGRLTFCPESPRKSPLVLAAQQGHLNVVQYFLDTFINIIDINYGMSIVLTQEENRTRDNNLHDASALLAATFGSHSEVIELLVSRGADVSKPSFSGCAPIHAALELGNVKIFKYVIKNGANVNQQMFLGRNALGIAISLRQWSYCSNLVLTVLKWTSMALLLCILL